MFDTMKAPAPDSLVEVGRLFHADPRLDKVDLGIGTYRDGNGLIRVMAAVKQAEERHLRAQTGKGYLGPGGDQTFCELLANAQFPGLAALTENRLALVQAPGGTGAYRLGLELIAHRSPTSRLIVGVPTWPNHIPVAERVGLPVSTYPHYDPATGRVNFDRMLDMVSAARPGDLLLLHGCCHNPTGTSLSQSQWIQLGQALLTMGVFPVLDMAYAGMSRGFVDDGWGIRHLLDTQPEAIVALSCSKSFGLYSERTGMLAILANSAGQADACRMTAETLARRLWSNPPDHGAAVVRTILEDDYLRETWTGELAEMRKRLAAIRARLSVSGIHGTAHIAGQEGLFAVLPIDPPSIAVLRERHGIYMDVTGRINIAGLNDGNIERFVEACRSL